MQQIMEDIDSDGSGVIDYTEFLAATLDKRVYLQEDACWTAFRTFDVDGDGKITQDEIRAVLNDDNVSNVMGVQAIADMMKQLDTNGDGEIDFDEFMAMMKA
jgi:calcium-dependent protein kinase